MQLKSATKTEGGTTTVEEKQYSVGRVASTAVGTLIFVADILVFVVNKAVIPVLTSEAAEWSILGVVGHLIFLGFALVLFDRKVGADLLRTVIDRLPVGK